MQRRILLAAAGLAASASASAHGPFGADTSIWTSTFHLATSPLSLAALIGLTVVLCCMSEKGSIIAAALAALAAVLATLLLPIMPARLPAALAPTLVVFIGLAAVGAWKPPAAAAYVLALMAGLAAGIAADVDNPRWQDLVGMAATVLIMTFWLLAASDNVNRGGRLSTVIPIARRVAGSWITAIALLLGALALLGKHT